MKSYTALITGGFMLLMHFCTLSLQAKPGDGFRHAAYLPQQTPGNDKTGKASREVRGAVTDSAGQLMPGVSITVKDRTLTGTSTDLNGKYILDVPDENAVLIFSMVGFQTQEIPVKGREVINVSMQKSVSDLDNVVVVAFGKQKKQDVIGAVTSISPKDLKVPSSNLTTAFAGRLAGVIAYQRSGEPGLDNADFFIRGVTTFGYKKDPLILIDGVELTTTDLARLQVDDIASFSIMKDATATALYGARGANGVILVTTKEGKEGVAKLNVRLEGSLSKPTKNVALADPITYMELANEAVLTRNPLGKMMYEQSQIDHTKAGDNPLVYPTVDWQKMLIKKQTFNQRANLNISGGGKVARYYVAGSYTKDNGVLKVDGRNNFNSNIDLKSYLLRSNVNVSLTKSTELIVRLHGQFDEYQGPIDGGAGMYRKVMRANPAAFPATFPADEEHRFTNHILFGNHRDINYLNPYADMVRGYKEYSRSLMLAQLELKQDLGFLTKGLSFRAMANTNRTSYFDVSRAYNPFYYYPTGYDKVQDTFRLVLLNENTGTEYLGYSEGVKEQSSMFYFESALNYNRTFGAKHNLSGLVVFMARHKLAANAGTLQKSLPYRNLGLSGRATYSYDNRYFGEFNFGYNGSERFDISHRYGFFPSAGIAWFVSHEKFFEPLDHIVSKLKLRATYGLVGNDAIGDENDRFYYLSDVDMDDDLRRAYFGRENATWRNGISIMRYENRNITWEKSRKTNIGMELGLWNKIEIQADYFTEHRTNILMNRTDIPTTMGLSSVVRANVGEATGKGLDLSIDYTERVGKDFWATVRGNFTYATSRVKVYEEPQYDERYLSHVGYSTNQTWGYIAERLFVDDGEVLHSPRQNFGVYMAGDIKYRDVNGDGEITTRDRVPIGYPTVPEIVYGFGFSSGYKNFDLSVFFQGLARESFWIDPYATAPFVSYRYSGETINSVLQNQLLKAYADDHWSEENRNLYAIWPRLSNTYNANNAQTSTWFMQDGAFLRLKSAELGYHLPDKILRRYKIDNLRFYISGTNLLTWSKFKLWDVEMGGNGLGYPVQKVYNAGIQISF